MKYPSITELVLRDGQQSLIATRMSLSDMIPILSKLDNIGFSSLEMWGGATYDCCLRFLNEDPWERLRVIKSNVKKTHLQMLLRGKNLVGYKKYDDSVIDLFIKKSSENGINFVLILKYILIILILGFLGYNLFTYLGGQNLMRPRRLFNNNSLDSPPVGKTSKQKDIADITYGIDIVKALKPRKYKMKDTKSITSLLIKYNIS